MPNRLALETSPYLQQHANNPVDWYSWGPEALELAAHEDRPIFLSIGYSSCHWCHVMERESFEDPEIAALMNRLFVCIKVDREERPDLDAIYMQAVVAVSGAGGWPMSVFLTPDLKPFYGGTYYPPQDRGGLPSFRRVLEATANAYQQRRNEVVASAEQIVEHLRQSAAITGDDEELTPAVLDVAFKRLAPHIDTEWGGFGTSIKFPQPMVHEFLLRFGERSGEPTAQVMVDLTLDRMMRGGIYDHLGGGFHRYSTERTWLVPHFEKMLYDNALLVRLYVHAYQAMGRPEYRRVAEETIDFILRDMRDAAGGFYTALDADSEGEEGLFYIWSRAEILERLGNEAGERFCSVYGVTDGGNFEGANILFLPQELSKAAIERGVTEEQLLSELAPAKATLLAAREKRVWPFRDEKALTGWNALMLGSLSEAAAVFDRADYLEAAEANADFLLTNMRDTEGRLLRTYRDGEVKLKGYLEDYAFLVDGLLSLYEATFTPRWLWEAQSLAESMLELFWDQDVAGFYSTGIDHEELLIRPQDFYDNAIPKRGLGGGAGPVAPRHADRRPTIRGGRGSRAALHADLGDHPGHRLRALALRHGLRALDAQGGCRGGRAGRRGDQGPPRGGPQPLHPQQGRGGHGVGGRPHLGRARAAGRPRPGGRPPDGIRLPELRVPAPGHRPRRPARTARRGRGRGRPIPTEQLPAPAQVEAEPHVGGGRVGERGRATRMWGASRKRPPALGRGLSCGPTPRAPADRAAWDDRRGVLVWPQRSRALPAPSPLPAP